MKLRLRSLWWKLVLGIIGLAAIGVLAIFVFVVEKIPSEAADTRNIFIENSRYKDEIRKSREILIAQLDKYPGFSIAVGIGNEVVWYEGLGYADVSQRAKITQGTRFRIYSLSKPITGVATAKLVEKGQLHLDTPIAQYLPWLPSNVGRVTTRQLASHLGGLRHYREGEISKIGGSHCETVKEAMSIFLDNKPVIARPGEKYLYSSYGFVLLSAVIESASGRPFDDFLYETILNPLEMANTVFENPYIDDPKKATFYIPERLGGWYVREAPADWDNTCKWGAGGLLSNALDLVKFGQAVINGDFLDDTSLDLLFTPAKTNAGDEVPYGFGWGTRVDSKGHHFASHSGGGMGGRAAIYVRVEDKIVVALLTNVVHDQLIDEASEIAAIFAEWEPVSE